MENITPAAGALTPFSGQRFLARKKVFKVFGGAYYLFDVDGETLRFYVDQKAFKLREQITVYRDESMQAPMLEIRARKIIDFSSAYDVTTPEGERVGTLRRKGLKSMIQDEWDILGPGEQPIGLVKEDSLLLAMLRRFLSNLIPQRYDVTVGGQVVASFSQRFNPFIFKMDVDFSPDGAGLLDRRLGIAAVILLLAIEGRQGEYD